MKLTLGALAICIASTPAVAKTWKPPVGCTPFVTVQMKQCTVGNFAKCGEGKKTSYLAHYSGPDGPMSLQQLDLEGRQLYVKSFAADLERRIVKGAKKPYSLKRLLSAGQMDWNYQSQFETAPGPITHVGSEKLSGKNLTIDRIKMLGFSFEETQTDSDGGVSKFSGVSYAVPEWHLELPGTVKSRNMDGSTENGTFTPVDLVFESESGFMSMSPTTGCGGS